MPFVTTFDLRRFLVLPPLTAWRVFVVLLAIALASEYWDKDPLTLAGGLSVPWPRFTLAILLLPLLIPPRDRRWSALLSFPAPLGPLLFFWFCCVLSVAGIALGPPGSQLVQYVKTLIHLTMYVVFTLVIVKWISWPRLNLLIRAYYIVGIAAAMLSLLQFVHGTFGLFSVLAPLRFQSAEYDVGQGFTVGFRASSFFGEASWAARYYVHFIALAIAFWLRTRRRRHLLALSLFVLAFYTANSLLGYVILLSFLLSAAVAQLWRRDVFSMGRKYRLAIGAGAYGLLVLWLAGVTPPLPDLIDRSLARIELVRQGAGAVSNRIDGVFAGMEVWKLAPVFGVGLGNIDQHIVPFYRDPEWVLRSRYSADSVYVQILAETGLIGALAFLWFWGRLLLFPAPADFTATVSDEAGSAYLWMRLLQLDLFAQAVGMLNSADYLNPHLWTVVAIVLACKVLIRRSATVTVPIPDPPAATGVPRFAV
jgi:hypothetical protein